MPHMFTHDPVPGLMSAHVFTPVVPVQLDLPPPIARSISTGRQSAPARATIDRKRDICRSSNGTRTSHPEIHAIVRERQVIPLFICCIASVRPARATKPCHPWRLVKLQSISGSFGPTTRFRGIVTQLPGGQTA